MESRARRNFLRTADRQVLARCGVTVCWQHEGVQIEQRVQLAVVGAAEQDGLLAVASALENEFARWVGPAEIRRVVWAAADDLAGEVPAGGLDEFVHRLAHQRLADVVRKIRQAAPRPDRRGRPARPTPGTAGALDAAGRRRYRVAG